MSTHKDMDFMRHIDLHITSTNDYQALTIEQKLAFLAALSGENMIITGGGGSGKSHLIAALARHHRGIIICGSTGISAVGIGGVTCDSLFGFGPYFISPDEADDPPVYVKKRFKEISCILLDEASMTRIDRFEAMNKRLQSIKNNKKPFGGLQIILCGDFCQLKPILNKKSGYINIYRELFGDKLYLFESLVYQKTEFTPYVMTQYIRQGNDAQRRVLRNLRMGHNLKDAVEVINRMATGTPSEQSIYLCSTNEQADRINQQRYQQLAGAEKSFYGLLKGKFKHLPIDETVTLKIGARVMVCANNTDGGYRNGDRGTVVRFTAHGAVVNLDRGPTVEVGYYEWTEHSFTGSEGDTGQARTSEGTYSQLPLKLAYAITIHKSQGLTLDDVVLDLSAGMWEESQAYVALSRVRDFGRLHLTRPLRLSDIKVNRKAIAFTLAISQQALARRTDDLARFQIAS